MLEATEIAYALIIAAGLSAQAPAPEMRMPAPTHEQTIRSIAACGVPAASIRITYEDDIQSDFVSIGDLGGTDEARMICVRKAIHPAYLVTILNPDQRSHYFEVAAREERIRYKAEVTGQLKALGMLDRVPRYDPRRGLQAFAHGLEAACGIRAGSALEPFGPGSLTFRLSFLRNFAAARTYDEFTCVRRMHAASNADAHDISLAFIGNAAEGEGER